LEKYLPFDLDTFKMYLKDTKKDTIKRYLKMRDTILSCILKMQDTIFKMKKISQYNVVFIFNK